MPAWPWVGAAAGHFAPAGYSRCDSGCTRSRAQLSAQKSEAAEAGARPVATGWLAHEQEPQMARTTYHEPPGHATPCPPAAHMRIQNTKIVGGLPPPLQI